MTQVAIKYVNPAKDGKKYGNIKDADGNVYWVPAGSVNQFQPNTTVDINLSSQTWGQNQVQVFAGFANGGDPAPLSTTSWQRPSPPAPTPPRPQANGHSNGQAPFRTPREMFISEGFCAALSTGKYDTQDFTLLAQALSATWKEIGGQ